MQLQLGAMQHCWHYALQKIAQPGGSFPDFRLLPILSSLLQQEISRSHMPLCGFAAETSPKRAQQPAS